MCVRGERADGTFVLDGTFVWGERADGTLVLEGTFVREETCGRDVRDVGGMYVHAGGIPLVTPHVRTLLKTRSPTNPA